LRGREREQGGGQRERETSRLPAEWGAQLGAPSQDLDIMT